MKRAILCAIVAVLTAPNWLHAGVPMGPAIALSPSSLKFDNRGIGSTAQKTLTMTNVGVAPLIVESIVVTGNEAAQFMVSPPIAAVDAGGSQTITVIFTQASAGEKSAVLSITSNAYSDPVSVRLSGPNATQKLSVGAVSGSRKGSVVVPISVDNAKGIAGGDLTLKYDANVLTAKQVKGADLLTAAGITVVPNLALSGQVKVSMAGAAGIVAGSGPLVNVTFDIKAAARVGATSLTLQTKLVDENGRVYATTTESGAVTVLLLGDVSGDQEIGAADAVLVLRHSAGLVSLSDAQKDIGDVNGDKALNSADAILLLRYSAGIITRFPREGVAKLVAGCPDGGVRLGELRRVGPGALEVSVVLESGVAGGDLLLGFDATAGQVTGIEGPAGLLLASNTDHPLQVRLSVARAEAAQPAVLFVRLAGGSPQRVLVTGQAFGMEGQSLGEVESCLSQPAAMSLNGYPNPFNPATTLRYTLAQAGPVELQVYDVSGAVVRRLVSAWQGEGVHSVLWDGRDEAGQVVASGLYLGCLETGRVRQVHKLMLLK